MICENPYMGRQGVHGCGQCLPCRINKRRIWSHRISLEAALHTDNCFVTLTYNPENVPTRVVPDTGEVQEILAPKDLQDWLKRLRKAIEPIRVRYFACGEYGDLDWRPHYHVALFGYPTCRYLGSRYKYGLRNCCWSCDTIRDTWDRGFIFVGTLEDKSAGYVAGYVTKKMTAKDDTRLNGRPPEFARMSLRPGLGADMMDEVASTLLALDLEKREDDVPSSLAYGSNKKRPLGRYLTRRLRKRMGRDEAAPESVLAQVEEELRPVRESAFNNSRSFKKEILSANKGKVDGMYARANIFKKRGSL